MLALLFGLIVGALIVFLILFLIIRVCKKMPMSSIRPASAVDVSNLSTFPKKFVHKKFHKKFV